MADPRTRPVDPALAEELREIARQIAELDEQLSELKDRRSDLVVQAVHAGAASRRIAPLAGVSSKTVSQLAREWDERHRW